MRLFLWSNMSGQTDFAEYGDDVNIVMPDSSNAHSGGIVVLAENIEQAIGFVKKYTKDKSPTECNVDRWGDGIDAATPIVLDMKKPGVVLYCDGNC